LWLSNLFAGGSERYCAGLINDGGMDDPRFVNLMPRSTGLMLTRVRKQLTWRRLSSRTLEVIDWLGWG